MYRREKIDISMLIVTIMFMLSSFYRVHTIYTHGSMKSQYLNPGSALVKIADSMKNITAFKDKCQIMPVQEDKT